MVEQTNCASNALYTINLQLNVAFFFLKNTLKLYKKQMNHLHNGLWALCLHLFPSFWVQSDEGMLNLTFLMKI
jgi:hypothetical protein